MTELRGSQVMDVPGPPWGWLRKGVANAIYCREARSPHRLYPGDYRGPRGRRRLLSNLFKPTLRAVAVGGRRGDVMLDHVTTIGDAVRTKRVFYCPGSVVQHIHEEVVEKNSYVVVNIDGTSIIEEDPHNVMIPNDDNGDSVDHVKAKTGMEEDDVGEGWEVKGDGCTAKGYKIRIAVNLQVPAPPQAGAEESWVGVTGSIRDDGAGDERFIRLLTHRVRANVMMEGRKDFAYEEAAAVVHLLPRPS
ncbi:hypothetical protein BC829DRAFT_421963 [Chytridium lagenaria]|nr:hypothetical protein BC829DRAFT_421963 [Chytridium lagenaria]